MSQLDDLLSDHIESTVSGVPMRRRVAPVVREPTPTEIVTQAVERLSATLADSQDRLISVLTAATARPAPPPPASPPPPAPPGAMTARFEYPAPGQPMTGARITCDGREWQLTFRRGEGDAGFDLTPL